MPESRLTHRLAAIVVADAVGYSRAMEIDESGTLRRLREVRAAIVDPKTSQFRGRIVKSTGDGWLAEYQSVSDAVQSSVEILTAIDRRNAKLPTGQRLEFRVGINLGEIVFDGGDIYGTGVNIAARLEAMARPGGICISKLVREQVSGILDLTYEDMGEQTVKNLATPIRCFAVGWSKDRDKPKAAGKPASGPAAGEGASIAVLPFNDFSPQTDQEYFADGMVDDIITALARFKGLKVIARNSTFAYKGRAVDIRQIAKDLGVRYVLEGSVRKAEERIRITGQLIDAATGAHLWADQFDGEFKDLFDLQDRITERVVGTLEPQIRKAEIERARRKRPARMDAYDFYLRALPHAYAMRFEDNALALDLLREATRLDPGYAPAKALTAWCLEQRLTRNWPTARDDDAAAGVRLAREALAANMDDANPVALAGFVLMMIGRDYDAGLAALHRAVDLNRNNAFVAMLAGWANAFAGDPSEAMSLLLRARALSPWDPASFYIVSGLAMANLLAGHYAEAADRATQSLALNGEWDATFYVLAIAHSYLGRIDDARADAAKLVALVPDASISHWRKMLPIRDPARLAFLENGLRIAGLPE